MQPMLNNPQIIPIPAMQYQYPNVFPKIASRQKTWLKATLLPKIFSGPSIGFDSDDSSYNRIIRPLQNPQQIIASVTPSSGTASTITITFSDTSYDAFRFNDVLSDGTTMTEGKVLSHAPGQVVLEVQPGSPYFDLSKDFVAGHNVYFHYNRSITFNSGGTENRFWKNDIQVDYSDITNNSLQLARNEKIYSLVGENAEIYVYSQQLEDTVDDHMRQLGFKYWFSKGGKRQSAAGLETGTVGIRERTIQSGKYFPDSQAPTLQTLINMADYMSSKNGTEFQNFLFVMGRKALISIQQDPTIKGLIQYAGINNTIGGRDVKGLDVQTFTIGNMTFNFMLGTFLSDTRFLEDWHAYSIYGMDLSPIPTLGMNATGQSPIMKIHRGVNTDEETSTISSYVSGKQGVAGFMRNVIGTSNGFKITSTNVDGELFNFQSDCGISVIADNWSLYEKR
jgi:hypothetical protein